MSSRDDPEFNKITHKWEFEDDSGQSFEQDPKTLQWIPIFEEEALKAQQAAYSVPGVDEDAPAVEPKMKKRKLQETFTSGPDSQLAEETPKIKPNKKDKTEHKPRETGVYVQNLPQDTTLEEMSSLFSKCGLLLEDPTTGEPRIKFYLDDQGRQKGDALVLYFREESVSLAIQMLDETSLRGDSSLLKVSKASFSHKKGKSGTAQKTQKDDPSKKKVRAGKMMSKLADWDDEDVKEIPRPNKFSKVVILKGMFSLDELDSDPSLLLDLKEDVREECERLGEITNVVLYDKEADGIISVRFKEEDHAQDCIKLMDGRYFGGRQIVAELYDGKRRYLKVGKNVGNDEDDDQEEEERLEKFGSWLEGNADE